MEAILIQLRQQYPELTFTPGKQFCWSPESAEIFYTLSAADDYGQWSLLHETGHALLHHSGYYTDFELVRLEVDAWEKARLLARDIGLAVDENHIQDCLDTYRDWLYKRSICPTCTTKCLQRDSSHYHCFNCHTVWRVTPSRFCRSYRSTKHMAKTPKSAVFHLIDFADPLP